MAAAPQHAAPAQAGRGLRAARSVLLWTGVLALAVYLWPAHLGGCTTLTLVSGRSMEPTYRTGDLVVARCGQPDVGDVVVYEPAGLDGARVIHRIVGGDPGGWQLQGDNNPALDPFTPTDADVVGVAGLHVPKVGLALSWATTPLVWMSLLVLALACVVWPSREQDA